MLILLFAVTELHYLMDVLVFPRVQQTHAHAVPVTTFVTPLLGRLLRFLATLFSLAWELLEKSLV
jgi:hypothetical protein